MLTPAGEEVLSRRGDLRIDMTGALVDAEQNQILGDAGPITVPEGARVTIAADGTVSHIPRGENALATVISGRIFWLIQNPNTLTKGLDGNIRADATESRTNCRSATRRWRA